MIKGVLLTAASITALANAQPASAQEASPTGVPPSDQSKPADDSIVVTGTRLKGDTVVGSAIVSVSRADIDRLNVVNSSQLFLNLPQVNNLGVTQNSRQGNGGSANFNAAQGLNIHGIGPYATLMLIDGRRVVPQGSYGLIVSDTSIIPTIALERVEVMADGASAVYGSDAVAGVANLVLRRAFKGIEASSSYGWADNYRQYQAGVIAGHDWGTGHAMLAYTYNGNSDLTARDRSFARSDLRPFGGSDFRTTRCNPGNITVGGVSYAIPAGGVTPATAGALQPGTANRCDTLLDSTMVPKIRRNSVVATFDQDVTGGLSVRATGFYAHRTFGSRIGLPTATLTVPATNAFFVRPAGTVGTETVGYAFTELPETPYTTGVSEVYQGTVGASLTLPYDWVATVDYSYGRANDRYDTAHVLYNPALTAALASSNPATAFNPYGAANSPTVLAAINGGVEKLVGQGRQSVADLGLSGALFALPAGSVSVAIGYQHQYNRQFAYTLTGPAASPFPGTQVNARRNIDSLYAEVKVPLIGPDMDIPGFYRLTTDVAVRYDSFSDVGNTTNPKVGVDWEVIQGLRFHGSYSTAFRAPALYHTHGAGASFYTQLTDPLAGGALVNVLAAFGGNAKKPETARTYTFGLDFKPVFVPGLSMQLSYFNVHYEGTIAALTNNAQLLNQPYYANLGIITRNPTAQQVAAFIAQLPLIPGVVPPNVAVIADTRATNLGAVHAGGLDYVVGYQRELGNAGTFGIGSSGTVYLNYKIAAAPGAPFVDLLGKILNPNKLQLRGYLNWQNGPVDASVILNRSSSYTNNLTAPAQKVASYATVDFHLGYDFAELVGLSKLRASVDVTNLFDRNPPFVNIGPTLQAEGGFDATQANPIGRVIGFTLKAAY
ncbi:MAG TPA: TonB-dependent receptor [Sphingobium sp.]